MEELREARRRKRKCRCIFNISRGRIFDFHYLK